MVGLMVGHVACGDCEAIRPGLIGQPVNTVTSLAYLAGAVGVGTCATSRRRLWTGALVLLGFGSVAYHGPGSAAGKLLHDVSLPAAGAVMVTSLVRPNPHRGEAALLGTIAAASWVVSRTDSPLCRPRSRWQWHGLWHVLSSLAITWLALGEGRR